MDEGGSSVGRCVIRRAYHFCIYQSFQDCLSRFLAIANVQHYSSSAPEPVAALSGSAASPAAGGAVSGGRLQIRLEGLGKGVVHVKGRGVVHLRVDQRRVQRGGNLVGAAAQVGAHPPHLVPVEVDGDHAPDIAAIGDLIALARPNEI